MERTFDHADRHRQSETRASSSDAPSPSARTPNLTRMWLDQASTSETSHFDQEKQPLLRENQELQDRVQPRDTLSRIKQVLIESYRKHDSMTRSTLKRAYNKIGEHYRRCAQHEEALFCYEIALALEKDSKTARQGYTSCISDIRAREAKHQGKEQGSNDIIRTDELFSRIEQCLAEGFKEHLKHEEEADVIKEGHNKIGEFYRENGQYKEALLFYNTALALRKNSVTALRGRGATYRAQGRFHEALLDLDRAIQLPLWGGETAFTLANRGATLRELGHYSLALDDLDKALKKEPDNLLALAHRGATYLALRQPDKALTDLDKALQRDPKNTFALETRAKVYQEKSKSSSSDHADRLRRSETRDKSSDAPPQSARNLNLIGMGQNPHQWSEQANASGTSHSDQEKQALQYDEREIQDTLSRIEHNIIVYYKEYLTDSDEREIMKKVHNKIGDQHQQAGRYEEALFFYNTALAFKKDSTNALKGRSNCLSAINARETNYQGERQELQNITQLKFNLVSKIQQDIIEGYRQHLNDGDVARAMQRVYNKIGDQHRQAGRHEEALFSYNIALALDKRSKTALKGRGATLRELSRFNEALIDLNKAIELSFWPGPFTLANRGATLQELGYPDKALTDLNKALEKDPENLLALAYRGATLQELNHFNEALTDLNKVLERDPNNTFALIHRGVTYLEQRQLDKALTDLNKVLERDPNNTFALAYRGATYLEQRQLDKALTDLNKALALNPINILARETRAKVYQERHG